MSDFTLADVLRIKHALTEADKRGLRSKPGEGNYSSAVFRRLKAHGLVDNNFWPTELGWEVRIRVDGSATP